MQISILGCGGGRGMGSRPTAFLVDESLMVDAGTASEVLSPQQCSKIDNILITHSHIDHIADLPFITDLIYDLRNEPIFVYGSEETIEDISSHIFNQRIWPDFSRIPNLHEPKICYETLDPLTKIQINSYTILPIPVNHTIPTVGYLVDDGESAFAFTGDTYRTDFFWTRIQDNPRLRAVIIETSFPDRLQELAEITGHLTPASLAEEAEKLERSDVDIYITHIKPLYREEVIVQLNEVSHKLPLKILENDMNIDI